MIRMKDFSITRGIFRLNNISLEIADEEILAIIGKTGAGKTILLESLAGLYESEDGIVEYDGVPIRNIPLCRRKFGFVYQSCCLFPHMRVKDNIAFGLKMHGISKREQKKLVENILCELEIEALAERWPETLSGGEKQRCALGRVLVLKPKILFMDEPFSALDPETRETMHALIQKIHRQYHCSVIFVTHDYWDAQELADRVVVMENGKLKTIV